MSAPRPAPSLPRNEVILLRSMVVLTIVGVATIAWCIFG